MPHPLNEDRILAAKNAHHQVTFDFSIKSIIPNQDENLLLIETADASSKTQTFLLLSFEPLEVIQAISFGSDYEGLVLKSFTKEQLLLVQYSDQNNPDLTNVYSFSWDGGDPIFSLQNTRVIQSNVDWLKVPHPHFTNKEIYIDVKSGTELKSVDPDIVQKSDLGLTFAMAYPDTSEYFKWFEQYFSAYDIVPCRQIEYLKFGSKLLISYYEEQKSGLANSLTILDKEGKMLECILLEEKLSGIGKDTFFVFRNKAIFITQKSTLNIYDL